ncbi:MAG: sigma-70 family RNA polymerase sigma factor [Bacteroidales bacterium]|nr:sigma-70 family RNA polymerase sigma factor [Bacteroidales bacterium]MBR6160732.1 sigma-70 family RNA polymerase sigma factor [Bacteroidales bacterium]
MKPLDPFEAMLHRHRGLLFSLSRHFSRRGLEIDDLLQEATVALWRDRERLLSLPVLQQTALIWKIGRNAIIDCLRRVKETEALPEDYEEVDEDRSLLRELHERIAQLDEPDRSIVRMQLEGYNYKEIGEQIGITEKNVSVRLVRIKEKLRKSMEI